MNTIASIPLVERLRSTRQSLLDSGIDHFDMNHWFNVYGVEASLFQACSININQCGTTACLAGHAVLAARQRGVFIGLEHHAAEWLGIVVEDDAVPHIFLPSYWTEQGYEDDLEQFNAIVEWLDEKIEAEIAIHS